MRDFNYKKKFGQNFLRDSNIVERIVSDSKIPDNTLVVEVGPGKGVMTKILSKNAKNVICYEIDEELQYDLIKIQNEYSNVKINFCDFLNTDLIKDIENYNYNHLYFISNIPYYITTPILMKIMETKLPFEKIVMMVQKEVGERFAAKPGSKSYSSITVFLNYFYKIEKLFNVSRKEFFPIPNVDSEVISFEIKKDKKVSKNEELFFKLVRDSFKYKRKTIKNNLKGYDLQKIDLILKENGFTLESRAEMLPYEIFVEISNAL